VVVGRSRWLLNLLVARHISLAILLLADVWVLHVHGVGRCRLWVKIVIAVYVRLVIRSLVYIRGVLYNHRVGRSRPLVEMVIVGHVMLKCIRWNNVWDSRHTLLVGVHERSLSMLSWWIVWGRDCHWGRNSRRLLRLLRWLNSRR
jgi:hypothetical protein